MKPTLRRSRPVVLLAGLAALCLAAAAAAQPAAPLVTLPLHARPVGHPLLRRPRRLRLLAGWSFAAALVKQGEEGGAVQFAPVSLTTLIDSPVITGTHLVDLDLGEHAGARHHLVITADRAADLTGAHDLTAP